MPHGFQDRAGQLGGDLVHDQRAAHAAAPGGADRVLDRHVVVDDHGRVVAVEHLGRHLEVELVLLSPLVRRSTSMGRWPRRVP